MDLWLIAESLFGVVAQGSQGIRLGFVSTAAGPEQQDFAGYPTRQSVRLSAVRAGWLALNHVLKSLPENPPAMPSLLRPAQQPLPTCEFWLSNF